MFANIFKFIQWGNKSKTVAPKPIELPDLGIDLGNSAPVPLPSHVPTIDTSYTNILLNKQENTVKYNNTTERRYMSEKYLVVLDTSNRPEVTDRGLKGGLKNFYMVFAATADQAREIVIRTFARNPDIMKQIQYSLSVTPLGKVIPHVSEQTPIWSYIPLRKGIKAPGQQSTPPQQNVNPNNPEEVMPMQVPPAPITPPNQDDTPRTSEIAVEAQAKNNPMAAMMSPTLPNGQPNPMFAMFSMFAAAMGQANNAAVPAAAPQMPTVTVGDPANDPILARNMAEVRSTAVARHQNSDPDLFQEEFTSLEKQEAGEIERFKQLPSSEQANKARINVNNDIDPELMKKMVAINKKNITNG